MQREVIKWLQTLDLSTPVKNPNRDLANGVAAAEIVSRYTSQVPLQSVTTGVSADSRRNNWLVVVKALEGMGCTTVRTDLVDEVLRHQPNAGVAVLENMYEFLTQRQLPMRSLNTDDKVRPYITPNTVTGTNAFLNATMAGTKDGAPKRDKTATQAEKVTSSAAVRLPALNASSSVAATRRALGLSAADPDLDSASGSAQEVDAEAPQRVQEQLALTANQEIAAGHAAARRQPRYAQPTATSLLRPANDGRQDVSLAKAKFSADAKRATDRNAQILAEHRAVKGWKGQDASHQKQKAAEEDAQLLRHSGGEPDRHFLLTTLLRGPYSTARIGARRRRRDGANNSANASSTSEPHRTRVSAATASGAAPGSARVSASARASDQTQHARKVQVNVLGPALVHALERSGAMDANRQVAEDRSVDVFRQCQFRVRQGVSCLLQDVLAAHHALVPLVEQCSKTGEGDALEDLMLAVMCHRDALPMDTLRACWASLEQNVAGIAAAICERPDEYHYILTALSFAFSLESAQVPLLHVTADTDSFDDEGDVGDDLGVWTGEQEAERARLATRGREAGTAGTAPRHRSQSVGEALLAATRRNSLTNRPRRAADNTRIPVTQHKGSEPDDGTRSEEFRNSPAGPLSPRHFAETNGSGSAAATRQRTVRLDPAAFHLASAFVFLTHLGAAVRCRNSLVAEQVLVQFFLPAAQTALLPHGSTAIVEAVARVLTAHICGTSTNFVECVNAAAAAAAPTTTTRNHEKHVAELEEIVESYLYIIDFLSDTLSPFLAGSTAQDGSSSFPPLRRSETYHRYLYHVVRQLVSLLLDARGVLDEGSTSSEAADTLDSTRVFFDSVVQTVTDGLLSQLEPALAHCFASASETERAIAVSLLAQVGTLLVDAPASMTDARAADATTRALLRWTKQSVVDVVLQHGVTSFFPSAFAAFGWELKVVTLELLTLLHRKMLTWRVTLAELAEQVASPSASSQDAAEEGVTLEATTYEACLSPSRLERATAAVLTLFDCSPPLQRQLALIVVGRRLLPDTQPRLALQWLSCLLRFPPDLFKACLLPYESGPTHMRRLTAAPRESLGVSTTGAFAGSRQADWMHALFTDRDCATSGGSPIDMSSVQMLLGQVEPEYVVCPLNQTWDTCSVVQTTLRYASHLRTDQVLAVVAAALLSPQPVETQREQLAHNVAQLTSATTLVVLSSDEDSSREEPTRRQGRSSSAGSDASDADTAAWATTLRDLAGTTSGAHTSGGSTGGRVNADAGARENDANATLRDPASMERHFWLTALRTILPSIEQTLFESEAEADASVGAVESSSGEAKQTAAAVLFTLFRRYAPEAYLAGHMNGQALLERSIDWASSL